MSAKNYKIYDLTISTVTPLHIGTGTDLLHEYDYAIYGGKTWRLNESELLDAVYTDDPKLADRLTGIAPAKLLSDPSYFDKKSEVYQEKYFRYILQGEPRSKETGAQLQEQIKTVFDEPYLPGSSLKGALRTAIAWIAWEDSTIGLVPDVDYLKGEDGKLFRSGQAAQKFEEIIFGKTSRDITKDFMRALQVSDSTPISINSLEIINIHVLKAQGNIEKSIPVEAEAIKKGVKFSLTLKIDTALFSEWAKRHGLKLSGEKWLDNLPKLLHEHKYTEEYIESEIEWYEENAEKNYLADVYKQYKEKTNAESSFLLQLGAGTGWKNKTLGSRLLANAGYEEEFMETLLSDTKSGGLGVLGKKHEMPQYLDEFPTSRSIKDKPYEPLGWVLVEMKER